MSRPVKVAIIGGSGLEDPAILQDKQEKQVDTPYGKPSDVLVLGKISNVDCVILARHGRTHSLMPSAVPYRANVWALRQEGVTHVLATTACGSLREDYRPGDVVLLDQFIDRTTKRSQTFFDGAPNSPKGVCHLPMAYPFCERTRQVLIECAQAQGVAHHAHGTNITIEGPRFSTRAESDLFRSWGAGVVNMTTVPEVVLANEAAMCYASMALVTDYDCWRDGDDAEHVSVDAVMKQMTTNAQTAKQLLLAAIPKLAAQDWSDTLAQLDNKVKSSTMGC